MNTRQLKPFLITFAILAIITFVSFFLHGNALNLLVLQELSLVEIASAAGYFLAVVYLLYQGGFAYIKKYFYIPVILLFMGLRELDFNARFTEMGILKTRFFISGEVPVLQKILAGLILLFVIACIVLLIKNHARDFFRNLLKADIIAIGVFLTIGLIGLARVLDGLDGTLENIGIYVTTELSNRFTVIEEIVELGIPYIILITCFHYFKQQRK